MPKMKHPEAKGTIDVRDDFVEMHESQGWVVVEAKTASK
jgi:hypothetical protein